MLPFNNHTPISVIYTRPIRTFEKQISQGAPEVCAAGNTEAANYRTWLPVLIGD